MLEPLVADNLTPLPGIKHGFFTREGGVSEGIYASLNNGLSSGDDPQNVVENRRRVAQHLSVAPEFLQVCHQIHSADVVNVISPWGAMDNPRADAMVTKETGIALGVLTADCVPLLFADVKNGVIGAAHAGWRGALMGIIENTVTGMEKLGASRRSIHAALGACIWKNSYEVGPEFPAPFLAENPGHQKFFRPAYRSDHYMFDLPGYVEVKLHALNLSSVESSPADTLPDEKRFFSYRRACLKGDKRTGSLIAAVSLEK